MKGHLIAQIALLGNVSFIYWDLMGLNICLPLLNASCFLLCTWLIGTSNIAVNRHIDFRGRSFLSWILCASSPIQKAAAELEKIWRCSWCTSASSVRIIKGAERPLHQKPINPGGLFCLKRRWEGLAWGRSIRARMAVRKPAGNSCQLSPLIQVAQLSKWSCKAEASKDRKIPIHTICR